MQPRAHLVLKQNIDALLHARGQKRRELAMWCRRTESWLSQIFIDEDRNVPLKYLDRIADFFGLATYQLFQPGISPLTERRTGRDRRAGTDRRKSALNHQVRESVSHLIATLTPADVGDLIRWRGLDEASRASVRETVQTLERSARESAGRGRRRKRADTAAEEAKPAEGREDRHRGGRKG